MYELVEHWYPLVPPPPFPPKPELLLPDPPFPLELQSAWVAPHCPFPQQYGCVEAQ
ncbi:MAG: hypothetical protein AB7K71_37565 [Polyangiaceae bacterium]